jgi:hypothetical protein
VRPPSSVHAEAQGASVSRLRGEQYARLA